MIARDHSERVQTFPGSSFVRFDSIHPIARECTMDSLIEIRKLAVFENLWITSLIGALILLAW